MFRFAGQIGRKRFFWASVLRIGLFLASVVAFPFFLLGLAEWTGCRGIGGACGAVGLVGAMVFKPLVFAVFAFSFIGISMRRARDAGAPGWAGLVVTLLLVGDADVFVFAGAPWSFAFSAGVRISFPYLALFALACIASLCVLPSRGGSPGWRKPFGTTRLAATVVPALAALALVSTIVAAALAMPSDPPSLPLPVKFWVLGVPTIVPTFVLYFCLLLALSLVIVRRSMHSIVFLVLALLPFGLWGYEYWVTSSQPEREAAEIAALPRVLVPRTPVTIVFESASLMGVDAAWTVPGIEQVISKTVHGRTLMRVERPTAQGEPPRLSAIKSLPEEYLLLRIGPAASTENDRQIPRAAAGPVELRVVDGQRNDLIAVWHRSFHHRLSPVPLLTENGWFRQPMRAATSDIETGIREFLARTLILSR